MITFHKIKTRNFLSVGDDGIEIQLDKSPTTLVAGVNGSGKSVCYLDSICFALFGRAFRDIKKGQLVNSINNKDCVVEIEFSINSTAYRVVRGLKPNIFEIYINGELLNQDAHTRDYQEVLETSILKLSFKTFTQVSIVGSASYVPFMQLPTGQRREVIEDLLDIKVFSAMNSLLKERVAKLKEEIKDAQHRMQLVSEKKNLVNRHIVSLTQIREEAEKNSAQQVDELRTQIDKLSVSNASLQKIVDENTSTTAESLKKTRAAIESIVLEQNQLKTASLALVKDLKFYTQNDSCPTCRQHIPVELKSEKQKNGSAEAKNIAERLSVIDKQRAELDKELEKWNTASTKLTQINSKIASNNATISAYNAQIASLTKQKPKVNDNEIVTARESLKDLETQTNTIAETLATHSQQKAYNDTLSDLLKDTGIKTRVIRQYLPTMNKLINGYLQVLDFYVSFHLDESFNELIKSRHRDAFTYLSFSEGEKSRIDLALLFSWRQIARAKNSVSTNLLIIDEIFDSSMDSDGIDNLLSILSTLEEGTNVFVITHKHEALSAKFSESVFFRKEGNFTAMVKE